MKNKKILSMLGAFSFVLFSMAAHAQEFQNSNAACETELVSCSSPGPSIVCGSGPATSIRCKNESGTADFDGDTFVDCAASAPGSTGITGAPMAAFVLINKGSGATSCSSGSGSQFNTSLDYGFSSFINASPGIFGSIVVGNIDGTGFSNMEIPALIGSFTSTATAPNTAGTFGADNSVITTTPANWQSAATQNISSTESGSGAPMDRTQALIDCAGNGGPLDLVIPVAARMESWWEMSILKAQKK